MVGVPWRAFLLMHRGKCAGGKAAFSFWLNASFEVAEDLAHLFKIGKGVGVALDDLHHFADLALVDDADHHVFVCVRIHSVHLNARHAVVQARHQLLGEPCGIVRHDLKLVAVFDAAQTVIHDDVGDKEVEQGTDHGGDLHTVNEEGDQHHAGVQNEGDVGNIHFGLHSFDQGGYAVRAAAGAKALQHQGKAKARDHTRGDAGKHDVKILLVIGKAVGACAEGLVQIRDKGLHHHIQAQNRAELFVDQSADQDKDRQIEGDHQDRPADLVRKQMVRDGCESPHPSRGKAVAVLEEIICAANDDPRRDGAQQIE